jgi:hypothetical protein
MAFQEIFLLDWPTFTPFDFERNSISCLTNSNQIIYLWYATI